MASPAPASAAKTCVACNADVTNAPRMKDPQGKYYCQACATKQQGTQPKKVASAAAAVAAASDDVMAKIIEEATAKTANLCPGCQHPFQAGAKICTSCGMNFELGKKAHTKVLRDVKERSVKSSSAKISDNPVYQFLAYSDFGITVAFAAPLAIFGGLVAVNTAFFGLYVLTGLVMLIVTAVVTIKDAMDDGTSIFRVLRWWIVYGIIFTSSPRIRYLNIALILAVLAGWVIMKQFPELEKEFAK
jgi:hypothetical protein